MAHPQIVDGGDGLQIWRVVANVLNKQSWTTDNGWAQPRGLVVGLTTPHLKKYICYETDFEGFFG
jgi:hypothetical protein